MNVLLFSLSQALSASNGINKAVATLANSLDAGGHQVSVVCADEDVKPFFAYRQGVHLHNLGLSYKRNLLVKLKALFGRNLAERHRIKYYGYGKTLAPKLSAIIEKEKPDAIICYQIRAALIVTKLLSVDMPVMLSCHRQPDEIAEDNDGLGVVESCDALHVLIAHQASIISEKIGGVKRIFVIGNEVTPCENARPDYGAHRIIHVGKVVADKNQLLLIDAFQKLADDFLDWTIDIWGSTSESPSYFKTCEDG